MKLHKTYKDEIYVLFTTSTEQPFFCHPHIKTLFKGLLFVLTKIKEKYYKHIPELE